jgi:hypothetical protein
VTIAVTESGRVFAVGDKLASILKIETKGKFGFFEIPLADKKETEVKP